VNARERKPDWLKVRAPSGEDYARVRQTLGWMGLRTVCQEAHCPNVGECWGAGTATVMVLGSTCTRRCRFCAVGSGQPEPADSLEPERVAEALTTLGLHYVVLTMVDRDDLPDGGAAHMASTVQALRARRADLLVEALVGDFAGRHPDIDRVLGACPDVFAHNIEVTRRLTHRVRDGRCSYERSLEVLAYAKRAAPRHLVKSSLMVGLGESDAEVVEALGDLRGAGVDVVTIGQYLRPTERHAPVERYVAPGGFAEYERAGYALGFAFVASGPLVRSSYRAAEAFVGGRKGMQSWQRG
jgi:lipoic acid synthetase